MVRPSPLVIFAAVVLAGCSESPTQPRAATLPPSLAAGAVTEKGEGIFNASGTDFISCIGEPTTASLSTPYRYTMTVTPSGNRVFADHFIPNSGTGTLVGLTSGKVWTQYKFVSPEVIIASSGQLWHFTASSWWRSEDGEILHLQTVFYVKQDANGVITAERIQFQCKVV